MRVVTSLLIGGMFVGGVAIIRLATRSPRPKGDVRELARSPEAAMPLVPADSRPDYQRHRRFAPELIAAATLEQQAETTEALTPAKVRDATIREVRESGVSRSAWTKEATIAMETSLAGATSALTGRFRAGAVSCFEKGCMVDVRFADDAAVHQLDEVMLAPESAVSRWPGAKYRSPLAPVTGGAVMGTWFLFPKDESHMSSRQ